MNSASMTFGRPTRLVVPRGSIWIAGLITAMIDGLRRLDSWQLNQQRNEPKTVEGVLNWARRIEATDPGFASDLRAAAMRSNGNDER
jgi:hypothetical protein